MQKILITLFLSLFLLTAAPSFAQDMVQIKGSDTLINVVQRLAEVYMEKNPGDYIAVTGGGSGTGVAALINKKCDIANASRLLKDKEIDQAAQGGIDAKRVVIAIDGLSVIVNPENPVTQLSIDEIGAIFRGDITNWSEVGGSDMPIMLYGRQSNSGTYEFLKDEILKGDYSQKMNQMNGNAQIVEAIKADKSGIGYSGVGYIKDAAGITVLKVAAKKNGDYVSPLNISDVESGRYPVTRPLNQYISGNPSGKVMDFIKFELSAEGQKIVNEEGFFTISTEYKELNGKLGL